LASLVDQIVMVVEAERTQRSELDSSLDLVKSCPNITLLLNKVLLSNSHTFGAHYYYGSES
jgi:receptor protein-tyrosine kinase